LPRGIICWLSRSLLSRSRYWTVFARLRLRCRLPRIPPPTTWAHCSIAGSTAHSTILAPGCASFVFLIISRLKPTKPPTRTIRPRYHHHTSQRNFRFLPATNPISHSRNKDALVQAPVLITFRPLRSTKRTRGRLGSLVKTTQSSLP
jgi:hypothetical protein